MTQQEFFSRTMVNVNETEFWAINEVYNNSDLDKDAFCKMWCKMNPIRVSAAKAAAKEAEQKQKTHDRCYDLLNKLECAVANSEYNGLLTTNVINESEEKFLESLGINVAYKTEYDITRFESAWSTIYDIKKYLHFVA